MNPALRSLSKASTGVAGLDEVFGGGVSRNRLHLLEGSPGAGKTTIALQFLMAGAAAGEVGVRIVSQVGAGTSVTVYLPRTQIQPGGNELSRVMSVADSKGGGANILLVDDDNGVREVAAAMLRDLGYEVVEAGSGGAALDLLQRLPDIDVMLIDFAMPGMSGADVVRRVRSTMPSLPTLFITGFADHRELAGIGESRIIGKPFQRDELAHKVRAALDEAGPVAPSV